MRMLNMKNGENECNPEFDLPNPFLYKDGFIYIFEKYKIWR